MTLEVEAGQFLVVAGPSGSGKTTLLNIIGMLDSKTAGSYRLDGSVIDEYGIRGGIKHDGINIRADEGTPVRAAKEGRVAFSGYLKGYGNTIIIEHKNNYATVYANNRSIAVGRGQYVKKGQQIAVVGGPVQQQADTYLHFQIRCANKPCNPRFYLPRA